MPLNYSESPQPASNGVAYFTGIDLGWMGKPSGLAVLEWCGKRLHLRWSGRIAAHRELLVAVDRFTRASPCWIGLDAPAVVRKAEREAAEFVEVHEQICRLRPSEDAAPATQEKNGGRDPKGNRTRSRPTAARHLP